MKRIIQYYLQKGDKSSALRIKKAYFIQSEPHQRDVRKKKRIAEHFKKIALDLYEKSTG